MSVKLRQELEKRIVTAAVTTLLEAGFFIVVDNGCDEKLVTSKSKSSILKTCFQTDDEYLHVYDKNKKGVGWIHLVYGNDGYDVISDYTVNLEEWIGNGSEAQKISDQYS
jgi:hypothetical protein